MTKIHVERKDAKELADLVNDKSRDIYEELTNERKFITDYLAANLIELDKNKLDTNIATINEVLRKIKSLKEFKPKKRQL